MSDLFGSADSPLKFLSSGSAKDLYELKEDPNFLAFRFSERISVFDYGVIPDLIPNRSSSLRRAAFAFEEIFEKNNVPTLFDKTHSHRLGEFVQRKVYHPKHMPDGTRSDLEWNFIPLEVIFRWGAPMGSSYLKRHPEVRPFEEFANPRIEFSTKLESTDRILTDDEARELMPEGASFAALKETARHVAEVLKVALNNLGLDLWDGKIECAAHRSDGGIALVDAMTPDELRVGLPGLQTVPLSKELLRMWLGPTNWGYQVSRTKREFGDDWRDYTPAPPSLGEWRVQKIADLYTAFAETFARKNADPLLNWVRRDASKPKVFIAGSGGRETSLRWRLDQEGCEVVENETLADAVFLTRDADIARGLADDLEKKRYWVFGASQKASEIEWSKFYGRELARTQGIPVPHFTKESSEIENFTRPPVIKFDGLAEGKGVVVPESLQEAREALNYWRARGEVLLEERLEGIEASAFFGVRSGTNGVQCVYLGSARDFKRRYAGDSGPNTGGMGVHAPHPQESAETIAIWKSWAQSTCEELAHRKRPYNGVLYLGLMKDKSKGWHLIEYNARPGDPETQALVEQWPLHQPVLRSLLSLSVMPARDQSIEESIDGELKTVALALVNPQYPDVGAKAVNLPDWAPPQSVRLFRTSSTTGRMAYLVGRGASYQEAGDKIFAALVESPWKDRVEWRPDILE